MDVVERFREILKPIMEEKKKKPKIKLSGQYKEYPNKDDPAFFYPPKNYRPTPIPRPKDLILSEEQWNQFYGDVRMGVVPICLRLTDNLEAWANLPRGLYIPGLLNFINGVAGFINIHIQIQQSIPRAVIGLIIFAAEQIIQSETESKDQQQLSNEFERIVTDGTDDNRDDDQSEHAIESKHFINKNDGLRKNDSGTQLKATVNGEANPEFNITKIPVNTPPYNVNGSDGLGENDCGKQLQAATNENGYLNYQAIENTGKENNNEQAIDNRAIGKQNNQRYNNKSQYEQEAKLQVNGNTKLRETGLFHTTHPEQEIRIPNISQSKVQPQLITTPPELGQVKGKVIITKQRMHPTNDHYTRSKTCQTKSVPKKSLGSPEARANSDTPNHFVPQQEQRKKADVAPITEDKSAKHSKSNKTSAGSKKQIQGSNSENQKQIEPNSETDQPEWLD
ncbi:MAG: hypothetical protein EZS28_010409 [Streblomastix strix]|uniref:Uncharacterized protein n=1 Tax=Streblomastix strix TaxID=222440 RepID=A0A5J4WH88_9EUKA|nr:MAG: hypothetical protein EZS28_010409 [Streblomastix strix]